MSWMEVDGAGWMWVHDLVTPIKKNNIKNLYAGKKRKAWNKPTKPFPNKWKSKLAKSNKDLYYNEEKWINEHEYGKGRYYNEYYDDDLDFVS